MNSLTEKDCSQIVRESHKYSIWKLQSGHMLYKFIMSQASIDTWATLSHICNKIATLDVDMTKASNDIIKFNEYETKLQLILKAR